MLGSQLTHQMGFVSRARLVIPDETFDQFVVSLQAEGCKEPPELGILEAHVEAQVVLQHPPLLPERLQVGP